MTDSVVLTSPYAAQPWKAVYLAYQALTTVLRIPFWTLYLLLPSNRAKTTWSFKRALIMKIFKHVLYVDAM